MGAVALAGQTTQLAASTKRSIQNPISRCSRFQSHIRKVPGSIRTCRRAQLHTPMGKLYEIIERSGASRIAYFELVVCRPSSVERIHRQQFPTEAGVIMHRIGLALSGGGFRATLYHLGMIRFLREANVLPQVKHITSV